MKKSKLLASLSGVGIAGVIVPVIATACSNNTKTIRTSVFWKTPKIADTVYTIDGSKISSDLKVTIESLQGILAQKESKIFIYSGDNYRDKWFKDMKNVCGFKTQTIDDPWELLEMFKDEFNSKFISYKNSENDTDYSINVACSLAGIKKNIVVSEDLESDAVSHGYTKSLDATTLSTIDVINNYGDQLNKTMFFNQAPFRIELRDYMVASKSLCACLQGQDETTKQRVASWLNKDAVVLGWNDLPSNELEFVKWLSEHSLELVPDDRSIDLSFYSAYRPNKLYKQKRKSPKIKPDKNKHYLAMLMSDGDNVGWLQGDFLSENWYSSPYRGQFPMSWTIAPSICDLNANIADYLYDNMTDNDYFVTGPSGFGYRNLGDCDDNKNFSDISTKYMHDMDQHVVDFIDWHTCYKPAHFKDFMKSDTVKGGIWAENFLYLSGAGEVIWINNKPIIAVREAVFGERVQGDLLIEPVAQRINNYPCDPSKIDGYTIMLCGCWKEGKMNKLRQFVDLLDDHVELVTVDQIFDMVNENVKHENAIPKDRSPIPYEK